MSTSGYGDGPVPPGARRGREDADGGAADPGGLPTGDRAAAARSGSDAFGRPAQEVAGGGSGSVLAGFDPTGARQPAPHGRRLAATVLDAIVVAVIAIPLVLLFVAAGASVDTGGGLVALFVSAAVGVALYAVAAVLYAPASMAVLDGRTLGKAAMGLRVVRESDGTPVRFRGALIREVLVKAIVVGIASAATGGLAYIADVVWAFVDDERRALHDLASGTRVVRD